MVFCTSCGKDCGAAAFCGGCGTKLAGGSAPSTSGNLAGKYDGQQFYSDNFGAGSNQNKNVELFTTSATASLIVKKEQQSLKFLLDGKKVKLFIRIDPLQINIYFNVLNVHKVHYVEYDVASNEAKRNEMRSKSGQTKLPQLFINGKYIGVSTFANGFFVH